MNADDKLRSAYRDLSGRAERAADQLQSSTAKASNAGTSIANRGRDNRLRSARRPLLAAAAAIAVAAGVAAVGLRGDNQPVETDGPAADSGLDEDGQESDVVDGGDDDGADENPDRNNLDDPADQIDPNPADGRQRLRVATAAVAADTADPYLNVRATPNADGDLMAKLPATYTGLLATGETETAADGGTWVQVQMLDPVYLTLFEPLHGARPIGWVNQAFVEVLPDGVPVGTDELAACQPSDGAPSNGGGSDESDSGNGFVYALESAYVSENCLRVVLTFADGPLDFFVFDAETVPSGTGPATSVPPSIQIVQTGTLAGAIVDLGSIDAAFTTETNNGIYLVRQPDQTIDLVAPFGVDGAELTLLADRGLAVVDLLVAPEAEPPSSEQPVVLTEPLLIRAGMVEATGLARPFERTLGVTVEDSAGQPVTAVFSGNQWAGTIEAPDYGVPTTDWTDAWGRFAVRVEGLVPGQYQLAFNTGESGDESEEFRVPFTIDEAAADEPGVPDRASQDLAFEFFRFTSATGPEAPAVPTALFADEVTLALGPEIARTVPRSALSSRETWTFEPPGGYAGGFVGPFSAIDDLDRALGLTYSTGSMAVCAGSPRTWPETFARLDQINIEPIGIDSCIAWFGVSLFVNDDGQIEAVALDHFGP